MGHDVQNAVSLERSSFGLESDFVSRLDGHPGIDAQMDIDVYQVTHPARAQIMDLPHALG